VADTIIEWHTTVKYKGDTYYVRPWGMSDKEFFLETWADFPTENPFPSFENTFEKRINMFSMSYIADRFGEAPIVKGKNMFSNGIYYKNDVPFGLQFADLMWEGNNFISKRHTLAIHPDFRGQGLTHVINGVGQYWTYYTYYIPVVKTEIELYHNATTALQFMKDNNYKHEESVPANVHGTANNSVLRHKFSHTPSEKYAHIPGATFQIQKHEYDITDKKYATNWIASGQRDIDLGRKTESWDHDL